ATSGTLATRFGTSRLATVSSVIGAIGLATLAIVASWPQAIGAALIIGLGTGGLDASMNTHVALTGGVRSMGLLHASWALGAALGPALVGVGESLMSWRASYVVAAVSFALIALALGRLPPAPRDARASGAPARALRLDRALLFGALMFFIYVGLEAAAGQWAFVDLTVSRGT